MHTHRSSHYITLALVLLTVGYGIFEARSLIIGPVLTVQYPTGGATVTDATFEVRGKAKNVTRVTVNGGPVTMGQDGTFKKTLLAPQGYGVLLIEAKSRFGRTTSKRVEIYGKVTTK